MSSSILRLVRVSTSSPYCKIIQNLFRSLDHVLHPDVCQLYAVNYNWLASSEYPSEHWKVNICTLQRIYINCILHSRACYIIYTLKGNMKSIWCLENTLPSAFHTTSILTAAVKWISKQMFSYLLRRDKILKRFQFYGMFSFFDIFQIVPKFKLPQQSDEKLPIRKKLTGTVGKTSTVSGLSAEASETFSNVGYNADRKGTCQVLHFGNNQNCKSRHRRSMHVVRKDIRLPLENGLRELQKVRLAHDFDVRVRVDDCQYFLTLRIYVITV